MIHNSISFVFLGTDDFSVIVLEELKNAGLIPALVVTQPDRPKGRGLLLTPPPAKEWALKNTIECFQPKVLGSNSSVSYTLKAKSYQLFIVASYGLIIPQHILDIPKHGTLNVHPSLLPKYRGATPIESQILSDEKEIGVTIMLMDERMDHGPIVAQQHWKNTKHNTQNPNKTQDTNIPKGSKLKKELAEMGGKLLTKTIPKWVLREIKPVPQDESRASYTKKFTKADGEIDLGGNPYKNFLKIQAFGDSIGTYFYSTELTRNKSTEPDGTIPRQFRVGGVPRRFRVIIKSADFREGKLIITRVIPEGKREMSYEEFLCGIYRAKK